MVVILRSTLRRGKKQKTGSSKTLETIKRSVDPGLRQKRAAKRRSAEDFYGSETAAEETRVADASTTCRQNTGSALEQE